VTLHHSEDKIGLWPLTSLVTGNLVGSGVYLLPTALAAYGSISILGWLITSTGAILLSLVFACLSSRHTKTGGPYLYAQEAFGDTTGYFVCWGYWMLSWISNPALAVAAAGYISAIIGGLSPLPTFCLELFIVAALTVFNLTGLKVTGIVELWVTVLKVIPLLLLPLIGLFFIDINNFSHFNLSGQSFSTSLNSVAFITLWAFIGLETGTVPAGQVNNSAYTVPRATILGTVIAAVVYILGTVVIMGVVPFQELINSDAPYAAAAHHIFGGAWGIPVAIVAVISCLGALNGWLIIVGRIPYGAAKDGLFPEIFKRTTRHGTPYWGVMISSLCSIPLLMLSLKNTLIEQFNFIIEIAVTLILLVYAVCVLAYFKLLIYQKHFSLAKLFLGVGALAFTSWALWAASIRMVSLSLLILVMGIPMRLWMKRQKGCV
jgi:APA family basic amino acid/polyamine antiporter